MKIIRTFVLTCLTAFSTPVHAEDFLGVTIAAEGRGEAEPIGDNATPEGRGMNRRVEIIGN